MDYFWGGGAGDMLLFSARRPAGGVIRNGMVACVCFVHAARFAQIVAISRTFVFSILLCSGRSIFSCRRNVARGFAAGFSTGGISIAHRIAHPSSFLLLPILVRRARRSHLPTAP